MSFSGYRTYLCAAGLVILAGLHAQGYIPDATYEWLKNVLFGGALAALRAGVKSAANGRR